MTHPSRLLIVNADDYGLTPGVSRAILHAHRHGIVTSTSVLAVAPGFASTAGWLRDTEGLGAGAHLALVGEDPPLLTALEVPTLVDGQGRFALSWRRLLPRLAAHQIDPDDIRLELSAQIERLKQGGLRLTHIDTHQHLHLWPSVGRIVLDLAVEHGIPAVRVTRSASLAPVGLGVRRLGAGLARRAARRGLASPAATAGLDHAGRMDAPRMQRTLVRLGACRAASAELVTHPGPMGDVELDRYQWGFRWAAELDALIAPETRAAVVRAGFTLGTYADLVGAPALVGAPSAPFASIPSTPSMPSTLDTVLEDVLDEAALLEADAALAAATAGAAAATGVSLTGAVAPAPWRPGQDLAGFGQAAPPASPATSWLADVGRVVAARSGTAPAAGLTPFGVDDSGLGDDRYGAHTPRHMRRSDHPHGHAV